jgi:glycyl-tRNA synthetase
MEKIVSLCKRRGFIFPGSEIYGGLAGTFDYGPLGVALKRAIENEWWKFFVTARDDMYGLDASIISSQKIWEASGHLTGFTDPLVEDVKTKKESSCRSFDRRCWTFCSWTYSGTDVGTHQRKRNQKSRWK